MFAQPFLRSSIPHDKSRDDILSRHLIIASEPVPSQPICCKSPIYKTFHKSTNPNPLGNLLMESKLLISNFHLQLPSSQKPTAAKSSKRTRHNDSFEDDEEEECAEPAIYTTPAPKKTIFFSPVTAAKKKSSKLLQSTPVAILKEAHLKYERSPKKLLKLDTWKSSEPRSKEILADSTVDDSDYDHLACHADNIMRMAVDSTMLGSSFNSTFSNTFANDSVLGSQKPYPDFLDEDSDRSVIENLKPKWTLAKLRATRIEINAEDLQAAVA